MHEQRYLHNMQNWINALVLNQFKIHADINADNVHKYWEMCSSETVHADLWISLRQRNAESSPELFISMCRCPALTLFMGMSWRLKVRKCCQFHFENCCSLKKKMYRLFLIHNMGWHAAYIRLETHRTWAIKGCSAIPLQLTPLAFTHQLHVLIQWNRPITPPRDTVRYCFSVI